jgi:hypothetical protein
LQWWTGLEDLRSKRTKPESIGSQVVVLDAVDGVGPLVELDRRQPPVELRRPTQTTFGFELPESCRL